MRRREGIWLGQVLLSVVLAYFIWRRLSASWGEFGSLEINLEFKPAWLVSSAILVWISYSILIAAWKGILSGWKQHIPPVTAATIWCLSNLGRYLPGKLWSLAGLALLARRVGVNPLAATGSALVMQALAVGTGIAVLVGVTPSSITTVSVVVALVVAAIIVSLLCAPFGARLIAKLSGRDYEPLPFSVVLWAVGATLVSWIVYGISFWMLSRGILPESEFTISAATGVFAAGYVVGLLALFAPGGIGVREGVFIALLTQPLGPGGAVALSVASRLLLTLTELTAALAVSPFKSRLARK